MFKKKKGFTLIELIMVIVIIGILAAIAVPKFINLRRDAQIAACQGSLSAIRTALSNFYARNAISGTAAFPSTLHDPNFIVYMGESTLPTHPNNADWDTYYHPVESATDVYSTYTMSAVTVCGDAI